MGRAPGTTRVYDIGKRWFDVACAAFGIVLLSPVFLAAALSVRLSSPGPIFYAGERVGLYGKRFRVLKFRTMVVGADRFGHTTALGDERLTRSGAFLRKYKLDELPQLINVLRGDMSLVGPRPEVSVHTDAYDDDERRILQVRPGITDYASIRFVDHEHLIGAGSPAEAHKAFVTKIRDEKNRLRMLYVERRSFVEDLRILALTVFALARKVFRVSRNPKAAESVADNGPPVSTSRTD